MKLAEIFNVSLDDLINFKQTENSLKIPPKGKHAFGVVTVGDKGQITLPVKARKVFNINPGDNLILLGDEQKGIAVIKEEEFLKMIEALKENTE
ncbi:MAG: AbrB/MazE/SpoVT family DNA-binding domain-containing protein [Treponema sp.]|nr:AbrB/MazE/SpoVT family DNA-binding domain-containing protein [Treponema sp.]